MSDRPPASPAADPDRYPSLATLRADHSKLLRAYKTADRLPPDEKAALLDRVAAFVRRGRDTGAVLGASEDRFTAQGLLTYWANILYRDGRPADDTDTDLAPFDAAAAPRLDGVANPFEDIGRWADAPSPGWARLVDDALKAVDRHRLVAVLGANGSGRHTLVQNGLLPALRAGRLPGSDAWDLLPTVTLGDDPFVALTAALAPPAPPPAGPAPNASLTATIAATLTGTIRPPDPVEAVRRLAAGRGRPAALVVERFGDLLAGGNTAQARQFADALLAVVDAGHRVVLTVNPARLGPVEGLGRFGKLFRQGQVLVAFSAAELRQMAADPAERVGLRFDEGVLDRLLMDVQGDPASLALLRFTLKHLWDAREGNRITHEAYDRLGGGRLGIGRRAEQEYARLDGAGQAAARALLLRLIRPATGAGVSCARVSAGRLLDGLPPAAKGVFEAFTAAGLVVPVSRVPGEPEEFAPVHEALATAWPRFLVWLDEAREDDKFRFRLTAAAEQWVAEGRKPGALWTGAALDVALADADKLRAAAPLDAQEEDFLAASVRRDRLVWWFVRGGITATVLALLFGVSLVALNLYFRAEATTAENKQIEKDREAAKKFGQEREAARLTAVRTKAWWQLHAGSADLAGDVPAAYLRYASAWRSEVEAAGKDGRPDDARAFGHLVRLGTGRQQQSALRGMAFQEDGVVAAAAAQAAEAAVAVTAGVKKDGDGFALVVRVWRPGAGGVLAPAESTRPLAALGAPVPPGAPSRVGGVFVAPGGGHAVVLLCWDTVGGVVCPLDTPEAGGVRWRPAGSYAGFLGKAEMSPDGRHVAVASYEFESAGFWGQFQKVAPVTRSAVAVWAAPEWTAAPLLGACDHDGRVGALAFDTGTKGRRLAAVFGIDSPPDTPVALEWELGRAGAPTRHAPPGAARADQKEGEALVAAYSPPARTPGGTAAALFVSRASPRALAGDTAWLFSPDRSKPTQTDTVRVPLQGWQEVTAAAFGPAGNPAGPGRKPEVERGMALGTAGGAVVFSRLAFPADKGPPTIDTFAPAPGGHAQQVFKVGFSPDGQYVVSAGRDRRAVVWATADRAATATLYHSGTVTDAAFTPDGRGVLTAAGAAAYRWDLPAAGAYPVSLAVPGSDLDRTVADDALSPDGAAFVAGGERRGYAPGAPAGGRRGWARAWDPKTGAPLTPELLPPEPVARVAMSPRAPWLVCTTGVDGTVRLWGPDGAPVWAEKGCATKATFAAFGDDGTALRLVVVGRQNPAGATGETELRVYRLGAAGAPDGDPQTATHPNPFTTAVFGPGCGRVAAYSKEEGAARGMVVVWDVGRPEPVPLEHDGRPAHREPVTHVGFAADGRVVTAGQDDEVVVWTPAGGRWAGEVLGVEPGKERAGHKADATSAAFDAGGDRVVSAGRDGSTIVWGREPGGRYAARLTLRAGDRSREVVQALFVGDRLVATASADNVVRVWDTKAESSSGRLVASAPFPTAVRHARWRPDAAGLGAVLGVGRVADPSAHGYLAPEPRPWAARFIAAEFPLTRRADDAPAEALVREAAVVAARKELEGDPTQLVGLPPGEVFADRPTAAPRALPFDAERHLWESVRCEAAANWAGARWHLDRLLERPPAGRPDLFARRAAVLARLGEWNLAEADYADARAGGGTPDVVRPLALMRVAQAEAEASPEKKVYLFGKAVEAYDRLSRLGRADPHDGLRLARAQLDAGTPAAAVETCNRLLADGFQPAGLADGFPPEVLALRAEAHDKLTPGRPQAAFDDHTAAARAFQASALLRNAAAEFKQALGLRGLDDLDKGKRAAAHADYGDVLAKQAILSGDGGAEFQYRHATALAPDEPDYWLKLGQTLELEAGQFEAGSVARLSHLADAVTAFHADRRHPTDPRLLAGRVRVRSALGQWAEALADARQLVHLAPGEPTHWHLFGDILVQRRRWSEAERPFREAVGRGVSAPAARFHAAAAAAADEKFDAASAYLAQLESVPEYRRAALAALAVARFHHGDAAGFRAANDKLYDLSGVPPADHAVARNSAAWVTSLAADQPADRREAALEAARRAADGAEAGTHLLTLGAAQARAGKKEAVGTLSKALAAGGVGPPRAEGLYRKAAAHLFLVLAYRGADRADDAGRELEKAREAVVLLDRALNPATPDADLPEDVRSPGGVAAAAWYRLELGLLLKELDPGRPE